MGWLKELYHRYLYARHLPRHWRLRPRTLDGRIVRQVVIANEYRLPDRFSDEDVILDVGAHVGSFALAALRRGAGQVHCVEPNEENFALLEHNLSPFGDRVYLHRAAVWRSDEPAVRLTLHNPHASRNTGAHQVTTLEAGAGLDVIPFDELVDRLAPTKRIRLLKLDCEGAEWPILLTSRRLDRIESIHGEYHLGPLPEAHRIGDGKYSVELLQGVLGEHGFETVIKPLPPVPHPCGLFFAVRPITAPAPAATR